MPGRRRATPRPNVSPIRPAPTPTPPKLDTATLEAALQQTLYSGARVGQLLTGDGVTPLVDLVAPDTEDDTNRGGMRAARTQATVEEAIACVGGTWGDVMSILMQLAPGTVGLSLTERRERCAELLNVSPETFVKRDNYEKEIMRTLLGEILRILIKRGSAA